MNAHLAISSILLATCISGSTVFASEPPPDLLAGPAMEQEEVTNDDMLSRRLKETGKQSSLNNQVANRLWIETVRSLELTTTQRGEIQVLLQELQQAQKEFQMRYGKELRELRQTQKNNKEDGAKASEESRKQMMKLREMAPDVNAYQERGWALFTLNQQKEFQLKYQALIEAELKNREERKNKDMPMDESNRRKLSPKDAKDRGGNFGNEREAAIPQQRMLDDAALRRIRFLRKLQGLQDD